MQEATTPMITKAEERDGTAPRPARTASAGTLQRARHANPGGLRARRLQHCRRGGTGRDCCAEPATVRSARPATTRPHGRRYAPLQQQRPRPTPTHQRLAGRRGQPRGHCHGHGSSGREQRAARQPALRCTPAHGTNARHPGWGRIRPSPSDRSASDLGHRPDAADVPRTPQSADSATTSTGAVSTPTATRSPTLSRTAIGLGTDAITSSASSTWR